MIYITHQFKSQLPFLFHPGDATHHVPRPTHLPPALPNSDETSLSYHETPDT